MTDNNALVLEIIKQGDALVMSIFEQSQIASTLRHFSRLQYSEIEIRALCREVTGVLNKSGDPATFNEDSMDGLKKAGQLLWDHLLSSEVKQKLAGSHIRDLVLLIDEELIGIPWELLYTGRDFLCLDFNLGRVLRTKSRSLPACRNLSCVPRMLILANPTGDLKSAYDEGINIRKEFDKKRKNILIDFKSTCIDTLYVKKNLRDYDIVHFAGHCEYDKEDATKSGWLLSDGIFNTRNIYTLAETLPLPDMIFSNGCHSASGNNDVLDDYQERTFSLACAFLFSGVRHYIGTIRKIEDSASSFFAQEFYGRLIGGGAVGECLRLARGCIVKKYGIGAIAWSSYILYGDPSFVLFSNRSAKKLKKRRILFSKRRIASVSALLAIGIFSAFILSRLPTLNPSTYFPYFRAREMFMKGDNQAAIALAKGIVKKDPSFLSAYALLAQTYQRLGDKENSLKCYYDYMGASERKNDKRHLACAFAKIGWVYYTQGDYQKSLDFYNRSLVLSRENHDRLDEANVLSKLAVWHIGKGDNDKALELLTKCSEINRERQHIYKHKYNLGCDYFNMAIVFTSKGDLVTAKEFYDKSFRIFTALKLTYELSDYYFNMGEIYSMQKEYQKAIDCYSKGLVLDQKLGVKVNFSADYEMFGQLYLEMENLPDAELNFQKAAIFAKETNSQPDLAEAYYRLGILYKKKDQKNKAMEYMRRASQIYGLIDPVKYGKLKGEISKLTND